MKTKVMLAAIAAAFAALAGERVKIWPEGKMPDAQPGQIAAMTDEEVKGTDPYLEWYDAPAKPNGCCMILISGGGYNKCCDVGCHSVYRIRLEHKELGAFDCSC